MNRLFLLILGVIVLAALIFVLVPLGTVHAQGPAIDGPVEGIGATEDVYTPWGTTYTFNWYRMSGCTVYRAPSGGYSFSGYRNRGLVQVFNGSVLIVDGYSYRCWWTNWVYVGQ